MQIWLDADLVGCRSGWMQSWLDADLVGCRSGWKPCFMECINCIFTLKTAVFSINARQISICQIAFATMPNFSIMPDLMPSHFIMPERHDNLALNNASWQPCRDFRKYVYSVSNGDFQISSTHKISFSPRFPPPYPEQDLLLYITTKIFWNSVNTVFHKSGGKIFGTFYDYFWSLYIIACSIELLEWNAKNQNISNFYTHYKISFHFLSSKKENIPLQYVLPKD